MKQVLVAYSNYDYLKYVKAWVRNARDVGKWKGDIVIIIPFEDKVKTEETMGTNGLKDLNIKLLFPKPFTNDFHIHYYKLFVFDEYFKQWDWIFHVDLDVIFNEEIDLRLSDRNIDTLYAKDDGLSLYQQFDLVSDDTIDDYYYDGLIDDYRFRKDTDTKVDEHTHRMERWRTQERNLPSELDKDVYKKKKSFQGCLLMVNKKIIEDGYFQKLKETHFKYAVYYGCCETFRDQTILNLVFDGKWDDLGDEYVNKIPLIEKINWDVEKLQNGYYDDYDYTGKSIIHFLRYFAPWDENNLRFYPIWKGYDERD